jgi:hypothetical protein
MFRVTVFAANLRVRNERFESQDSAEHYFEKQADSFFNDYGVHVDLEQREDGCWIRVKTSAGRRSSFPVTKGGTLKDAGL